MQPPVPRILFPLTIVIALVGFLSGFQMRGTVDVGETEGRVTVRTTPEGATVVVNGRLAGGSPVTLSGLKPGTYLLRFEKQGFTTLNKTIEVIAGSQDLEAQLVPEPAGSVRVSVKPDGAEVLLDGEFRGLTPLGPLTVPAGLHELLVRKTNFAPYVMQVNVEPGQELRYENFALRDLMLEGLRRYTEVEPQRVSRYVELSRYLFKIGQMEEAAEQFGRAMQVASKDLAFAAEISPADQDVERRLRGEDMARLQEELNRMRGSNAPGADVFRKRFEVRQQQLAQEHIEHWMWVRMAAEAMIRDKRFEQAEDIFKRHIAAAPKSPSLHEAYWALLSVRMNLHNISLVKETCANIKTLFGTNPDILSHAGQAMGAESGLFQNAEHTEVLDQAAGLLNAALAVAPEPEPKARVLTALAQNAQLAGAHDRAIELYRQAATVTPDAGVKEVRTLEIGKALTAANHIPEAKAHYAEMVRTAKDPNVKQQAQNFLNALPK